MSMIQRGRPFQGAPQIGTIREITRDDLAHLAVKRDPIKVQNLRDSHHRIARAIAAGLKDKEVCEACGISQTQLRNQKASPAFQELVAHYRSVLTIEWATEADPVIEHLRANALKAQMMLGDKLDDAMEKNEFLPTRDLLGIAELGLDRTGYGKVNKNLNVNIDFAAKLEEMRTRAARAKDFRTVPQIEASLSPTLVGPQSAPAVNAPLPPRRASSFRRL